MIEVYVKNEPLKNKPYLLWVDEASKTDATYGIMDVVSYGRSWHLDKIRSMSFQFRCGGASLMIASLWKEALMWQWKLDSPATFYYASVKTGEFKMTPPLADFIIFDRMAAFWKAGLPASSYVRRIEL